MIRPVRLTGSPSLISRNSPSSTAPTLSSSRFSAIPNTPCGNSSISPAIAFSTPCTRAMPSPIEMMLPTSATSTSTAKLPICSRMILEISSALISKSQPPAASPSPQPPAPSPPAPPPTHPSPHPFHEPLLDPLELPRDAAVVHRAADPRDDATDDRRIDAGLEDDRSASDARQPVLERLCATAGERRRRRHFRTHDLAVIEQPL